MHCYGRAAKRRRDRKYKRKLKRLHSFGTITPAIWYVDADYPYKTVNKPYFVKSYKSIGRNKGLYYIKAVFQMAMHIRNCLTYGGRFINWR